MKCMRYKSLNVYVQNAVVMSVFTNIQFQDSDSQDFNMDQTQQVHTLASIVRVYHLE